MKDTGIWAGVNDIVGRVRLKEIEKGRGYGGWCGGEADKAALYPWRQEADGGGLEMRTHGKACVLQPSAAALHERKGATL